MNHKTSTGSAGLAMTSSARHNVGYAMWLALGRKLSEQTILSCISIGLMSFHLTACWLARLEVSNLVEMTSRRRLSATSQNTTSMSQNTQQWPSFSFSTLYQGFLISACVVSVLETVRLAYAVHRMRVDYKADLDGLSKDSLSLHHQLVRCASSHNMALLFCLIVDHLPLSAILLTVQLQAPSCSDATNLLPFSVRGPRITLASFSTVADATWRLLLVARRVLMKCEGEKQNDYHWLIVLWSAVFKLVNVAGLTATIALASLCLVIQLMKSQYNVTPNGLLRAVGDRVQLENWIDTSCIVVHAIPYGSNVTCFDNENSQENCILTGPLMGIRDLLDEIDVSTGDVVTRSIDCSQLAIIWKKANCTSDEIVSLTYHCSLTFSFHISRLPMIEYHYYYSFHNNSSSNDVCSKSLLESLRSVTMGTNYPANPNSNFNQTTGQMTVNSFSTTSDGAETWRNSSVTHVSADVTMYTTPSYADLSLLPSEPHFQLALSSTANWTGCIVTFKLITNP